MPCIRRAALLALCGLAAFGCETTTDSPLPDVATTDAEAVDAAPDGGPADVQRPDANRPDAMPHDMAFPDGALPADRGPPPDLAVSEDAGPVDGAPVDAASDGPFLDPPAEQPAALFDADGDDLDRDLAAVVAAYTQGAATAAEANVLEAARGEAQRRLRAEGANAADRVAAACADTPLTATSRIQVCTYLLSGVESEASLAWLAGMARTPQPEPAPGSHPMVPSDEWHAASLALDALAARGRAGSQAAATRLLDLTGQVHETLRPLVVQGVYDALPRFRARPELLRRLPAESHYLVYELH